MLHDVKNDTPRRAFCGPTVIASITNTPVSRVKALVRKITGRRNVTGMYNSGVRKALEAKGLKCKYRRLSYGGQKTEDKQTFAQWLAKEYRYWPKSIYVIEFTSHFVAVYGDYFVDSSTGGKVIPLSELKRWKRARIDSILEVTRS